MADRDHRITTSSATAVLTRGFDPSLSFGSAPSGRLSQFHLCLLQSRGPRKGLRHNQREIEAAPGERADLIYSRLSHPNAEILEDQIVPLEPGATDAAVFNSGMAAIMTAFFAVVEPDSSIVYTAIVALFL